MTNRLEGQVAVITGAASGIGLGIARRFVAEGARVMLADVNDDALVAAADELGDAAQAVRADVISESDVDAMVARTIECFGRLDIGVNSAGIVTLAPVDQHAIDEWDRVLAVNLRGTLLALKHEAQAMRAADGGVIINIASINATVPAKGMAAYCASKAAVDMLTRVAALELGSAGVRVVGIGPGLVATPLSAPGISIPAVRDAYLQTIPLGRPGTPDDIAGLAVFLASADAAWVTGHTFYVDGGEANLAYPDLFEALGIS
jgi:NAD(P)-dependent dehydrogenase (short-subunit alcohol dehydrogenase family)